MPAKTLESFDIDSLSHREFRSIVERELLRRARISETKTGQKHTPEAKENISQGRRNYFARLRAMKAAAERSSELMETA
jgi:hypothetical protein